MKSCHVKEFKTQYKVGPKGMTRKWQHLPNEEINMEWRRWQNDSWTWNDTFMPNNAQFFEYSFHSPILRTNIRSKGPFKTVNRECWKMSPMSLIGNIGGALGMFIGVSFLGSLEWLLDAAEKVYTSLKITEY